MPWIILGGLGLIAVLVASSRQHAQAPTPSDVYTLYWRDRVLGQYGTLEVAKDIADNFAKGGGIATPLQWTKSSDSTPSSGGTYHSGDLRIEVSLHPRTTPRQAVGQDTTADAQIAALRRRSIEVVRRDQPSVSMVLYTNTGMLPGGQTGGLGVFWSSSSSRADAYAEWKATVDTFRASPERFSRIVYMAFFDRSASTFPAPLYEVVGPARVSHESLAA